MNKIKILSLILTMLLISSVVVACGDDDKGEKPENEKNSSIIKEVENNDETKEIEINVKTKESFSQAIESLVNVSDYQDIVTENNLNYVESYIYTVKTVSANTNKSKINSQITLTGNIDFKLSTKLSELEAKDWKLPKYTTNTAPTDKVTVVESENSVEKVIVLYLDNPTDKSISFSECDVVGMGFKNYSFEDNKKTNSYTEFKICNSITDKSNIKDVINELGNPDSIYTQINKSDEKFQSSFLRIEYTTRDYYLRIVFTGDGKNIAELYITDANTGELL